MLAGTMIPSIPCNFPRHAGNAGASVSAVRANAYVRMNKNPHAVALGSMTSRAKAEAAKKNGEKGGRPTGS